ncbi:MAG TPA: PIN domain-containing protein [Solirubrobacterales bacterium]|nr:PIN domain-containing protein [Solirubrobacterales bacterium]
MALILDTGPLLAALDAADPDHKTCTKLIEKAGEDLVVPTLVLAELDYWCHKRLTVDVWLAFLEDLLAGAYSVQSPTQADLERCHELQSTYADLELGVVDASVLALVERLGEPKLATLDHRHFATMRPRHVEALELLPD